MVWALFFFFSSRRRHTRFKCDWSSDVCSSDLPAGACRRGRRRRACCSSAWSSRSSACRSEEHTSELQSHLNLVCRLLLEKKKNSINVLERLCCLLRHTNSPRLILHIKPLVRRT